MVGRGRTLLGLRRCGSAGRHLGLAWGLCLLLAPSVLHAAGPLRRIPTVVHAHSTWSSGDQTLDGLIASARSAGVEAIFLAENHLRRFEYGLLPLRNLLRYRVESPSLLTRGPQAFLEAVREANARQNEVLLIPGVEIIPHYYWTGSLLRGTLTMHNAQKNVLAVGLSQAKDYLELPAIGSPGAARWGICSLWLLSPLALVLPGVWLLRTRRRRLVRLRHFRLVLERRFTAYGLLCLGSAAVLLANHFPFRASDVSPYDARLGLAPHQAVIDFVTSRGGLALWSLPEARDHHVVALWKLRATIRTDPYPADLLQTDRFTGFGGVYEDTATFTHPGGVWDRLLGDYLGGRRTAPAWAVGEAAYHREGQAGKHLGNVQTVFLADRKDPSALLDAFRAGRFYALRRTTGAGLILDQFHVVLPGRDPAEAGERLRLHRGDRPEVRALVHATGEGRIGIQVLLVRSGRVAHSVRGETPVRLHWSEPGLPAGTSVFYRLEVRGPAGHQILSNPIFVDSAREDRR